MSIDKTKGSGNNGKVRTLYENNILNDDIFLVTMDVTALYPNIDHQEGIAACFNHLEKRTNKYVPTDVITSLISFVLKSNTMSFLGKYFHQIKGTAMGTPMAVNYSNLFMADFESNMIQEYEEKFHRAPLSWTRYIDDIFFIWRGTEADLKHFLGYCDSYAKEKNLNSNIRFTWEYSKKDIRFLDVQINMKKQQLFTELYYKTTASHNYLQKTSNHPSHTIVSNPYSQFLRIRRICSRLEEYRKHGKTFIDFYLRRGYSYKRLTKTFMEVEKLERVTLLQKTKKNLNNDRVPFVLTWHRRFKTVPSMISNLYKEAATRFPSFKETFPEPPIVSYRRPKNIYENLSQKPISKSYGYSMPCTTSNKRGRGRPCKLCQHMGHTNNIYNTKSGKTSLIEGGTCQSKNVIYGAECTKHHLLYIGYTSNTLNIRFNNHRNDTKRKIPSTELGRHFQEEGCKFDDMKLHILENVRGDQWMLGRREDHWMTKLDTIHPNGLNSSGGEYQKTYDALYN